MMKNQSPDTQDRLSNLSDDLLIEILILVRTRDACATAVLSKRWHRVWTMLPVLGLTNRERLVGFVDKSLHLHKAPKIDMLCVELPTQPCQQQQLDMLVEKAVVKQDARLLMFEFLWKTAEPPMNFPEVLYKSHTLASLVLSNKILVDVPFSAHLPSLYHLELGSVVYKHQDSLDRLLSSSPILRYLSMTRHEHDNLTNVTIKLPRLQKLWYTGFYYRKYDDDDEDDDLIGSLVIDSPALIELDLKGIRDLHCFTMENVSCLAFALIQSVELDEKVLTSVSTVEHMDLVLDKSMVHQVGCWKCIKFSRLVNLCFTPYFTSHWMELLVILLQNSPNLTTLTIHTASRTIPPSWNPPSNVPGCLSSRLENFRWYAFVGREDEIKVVSYILANSKCLKTIEIELYETSNLDQERQMEIESMPRLSTSSRFMFSTTTVLYDDDF